MIKNKVDKDKRAMYLDYWPESKTFEKNELPYHPPNAKWSKLASSIQEHGKTCNMNSSNFGIQRKKLVSLSKQKITMLFNYKKISWPRALEYWQRTSSNQNIWIYITKFSMKETLHLVSGLAKKNDLISIRPTEMSFL